jgi:signal peptidase I
VFGQVARTLGLLLTTLLRFGAALLVLSLARASLADQYHVPTPSMWPTIKPGDRIFVSKAAFGLRVPFTNRYVLELEGPGVGDVVVFADPRGGAVSLVKRVVARAGQTVRMHDGTLYVDGHPQTLEELPDGRRVEHLGAVTHAEGERDLEEFGPVRVPADHVFVMGDNRATSLDSRFIGPISRSLLRGRVVGISYGATPDRLLHAID